MKYLTQGLGSDNTVGSDYILSVGGLKVIYHSDLGDVKAVDDVSIFIKPKEVLALVGESGSGKSTLGLAIMKLLPPTAEVVSGTILFKGVDILKLSDEDIRKIRGNRITMVFQEPSVALNPSFKVRTFLRDVILTHSRGRFKGDDVDEYIIELLSKVGIPSPKDIMMRYPHELSGGMKQRVLIAAAIANNPDLLIADEPTSALDVSVQAQILNLLNKLKEDIGMAMIFITHSMGVAAQVADRVAVMYAGKVVEVGDALQMFENPLHPYTVGLLKAIPRIGRDLRNSVLEALPGSIPDLTNPPPGCRFHPRCPYAMGVCRREEPKLGEVGLNHYVACWKYLR